MEPRIREARLSRISLSGFRNLDDLTFELREGMNLLVGPNGSGKTSLLEALYVLATGRSFRGASPQAMIRDGRDAFRIRAEAELASGSTTLAVEHMERPERVRRFLVGGKNLSQAGAIGQLPMVAVTAERMQIVRGAPEERRRFVDRGLVLEEPRMSETLRSLDRALRQKGALLSRADGDNARLRDALLSWNSQVAVLAETVRRCRRKWIETIAERLTDVSRRFFGPSEECSIRYRPSPDGPDDAGEIEATLGAHASREIAAGRCLFGPGRDDVEILLNGRPAREQASAGEQRAFVLALKLAKIEQAMEQALSAPILLLDDVDAELDASTLARFLEILSPKVQVLATSAKDDWARQALCRSRPSRVFEVMEGTIRPMPTTDTSPYISGAGAFA